MSDFDLERVCDKVLRDNLPAGLAASIRRLLEHGETPAAVLAHTRQAGARENSLTDLAIQAEIAVVMAEIQGRKN